VWLNVRDEVLDEDKHECQYCKTHGKYSKATIGHHQKHLRKYPELALSKTYEEDGETKRNIVSVCRECHKLAHPHSIKKAKPLTKERW
jgi:5-methylcytosine-specific restriction endonuclease McrA